MWENRWYVNFLPKYEKEVFNKLNSRFTNWNINLECYFEDYSDGHKLYQKQ